MIKRVISSILMAVIVLSATGLANTHAKIDGLVLDREQETPVVGATVRVIGSSEGAVTDDNGRFSLSGLSAGHVLLGVSAVGYTSLKVDIAVSLTQAETTVIRLEPTAVPVGEITVTASRFSEEVFETTQGISVVAREDFSGRSFSTTAEMLREEPGVLVQKTTHGHGAPIIRGLIGKYVLLLYDGIRLNKPTFRFGANQYLNTVDLESLNRIEVVRGPSSVMYGSDAIGGAVNLIPDMHLPYNGAVEISPSLVTRYSTADQGKSVNANLAVGSKDVSGSVGISYKDIGHLRAGEDIGKQEPTGWKESGLSSRLAFHVADYSMLTLDFVAVRQAEVPRFDKYVCGDFETYVYDPQDRDLVGLTFVTDSLGSVIRSVKANLSYQREIEGKTTRKTGSSKLSQSEDRLTTSGGYIQMSALPSRNHQVSFGGEYYRDKVVSEATSVRDGVISEERPTFPDQSKYMSGGLFAQDDWLLRDEIKLTMGLRYSRITMKSPLEEPFGLFDENYENITGSMAISYMPVEEINLIGRWSQGFRAPNLNDAVVLKYSSSGVDAPSVGLDPESSNNWELGVKVQSDLVTGGLFFFYNQLSDVIDRRPGTYLGLTFLDEDADGVQGEDEYDIYQRFNVDRAHIYGFEYNGTWTLDQLWQIRSNCFWTRGDNETGDEPMSRIPPLMGMLAVRYTPESDYWLEAFVRAAGDQRRLSARDIDDTRIEPGGTPGWATVNVRSHLTIGQTTLSVALENILDEAYKEHGSGVYSPGRSLVVSIGYGRN